MTEPTINPYQSPLEETPFIEPAEMEAAEMIRWAQAALWVAAICNLGSLYAQPAAMRLQAALYWLLLGGNLAWMGLVAFFAWQYGPALIFAISDRLHAWFGRKSSPGEWREAIYRAARRMSYAARIGALVWLAWLYWFFYADAPGGFAVNAIFLAAGHLLGAWVYIPLIYDWVVIGPSEQN